MIVARPDWDCDLSPDRVKSLSNSKRRRRARVSLERKIQLLERHCQSSTPFPGDLPRTRPRLRDWVDPALRIWAWSSPGVDDPKGKNRDLMVRYLASVQALDAKARKGRPSGRASVATLIEQNGRLAEEITKLRSENLQILKQNANLTDLNNQMKRRMQQ